MPLVSKVTSVLEEMAPLALAEPSDKVGLLAGRADQEIATVLLALDLTEEVLAEAEEVKAGLIITHHPPFGGVLLTDLRLDTPAGRLWGRLVKKEISLYTLHTNYDRAPRGLNDYLARLLHLVKPQPVEAGGEKYLKLVVFLPKGYEDVIMEALARAGAGWIGNYSHCTFQAAGTGTFLPREGTNPFLGEKGKLERAAEVRLETILPARLEREVLRALLAVHPYEEVAYDLYPLAQATGDTGWGRIGNLPSEVAWEDFLARIKEIFTPPALRCGGAVIDRVKRVAVLAGGGGRFLAQVNEMGADVFITSDLSHHHFLAAQQAGLAIIDPGHHFMESRGLVQIKEYLETMFTGEDRLQVFTSRKQIAPYRLD
jgi:dinuclear metal center YbgI/SA1388 family protein